VRYELFVSFRYLRAKRRDAFISLITFISMMGVTIGVMTLNIVLAVMTGFERDLRDRILGFNPHLVVLNYGGAIADYRDLVGEVSRFAGVVAAAPVVYGQAMLSADRGVTGAVIRGVDPGSGGGVIDLERYLKIGRLADLAASHEVAINVDGEQRQVALPGVIIGTELGRQLAVFPGDALTVLSPQGAASPMGMMPKMKRFVIVGMFDSGMYDYDSSLIYMSLRDAQQFLGLGEEVSGVEARVVDVYAAAKVARRLQDQIGGYPYRVRDWTEANRNLFAALKLEKVVYFIVLCLIVVVAAFNIFATLTMVVKEKRKDIAILKSMGAGAGWIGRVFMLNGLVIGFVGTLLGNLGGLLGCWLLDRYHFIELPKDVFIVSTVPVRVDPTNFLVVAAVSVVICLLASVSPAWRAANLVPAEVIRYE
jgi:lipoprotein-releasing system permease protein